MEVGRENIEGLQLIKVGVILKITPTFLLFKINGLSILICEKGFYFLLFNNSL